MLKIGVLGTGHLGKIHLKCIQLSAAYELVGFYDPDDRAAQQAIDNYGITRFATPQELFATVDVVDIVTPTTTHFTMASQAIQAGKHIFIEKPITRTVEEAEELIKLAQEFNVKAQVGHVERFNPALL
ncbi:MAG: Gfo/Idh/MocA family protein, partial [Saprospiraceae bacterium]